MFIVLAGIQAAEAYQEQFVVMFTLVMSQLKAVSIGLNYVVLALPVTHMFLPCFLDVTIDNQHQGCIQKWT